MTDDEVAESDDIVSEFEDSMEGELKQSLQEENASDQDYDYQQGFNYPEQQIKDSITKFYRHIISLMKPKQVVRVANFRFKEMKNAKIYLNTSDYNTAEGCDMIAEALNNKAIVEASVSMGDKGFIVTSIMTQRRIVERRSDKAPSAGSYSKPPQQHQGGK